MKDYLKNYKAEIHALSPIHIGCGEKLIKKEYIYLPKTHRVIVPDIQKMFGAIQTKGLLGEFTKFMLYTNNKGPSLSQWLGQKGFTFRDYEEWKKYEMDAGEAFVSQSARPKEIAVFIKDAYGMPYVPGSSIKGMFRTVLIAWEIHKHPKKFERIKKEIEIQSGKFAKRNQCLSKETVRLEQEIFHILNRDEQRKANAVNDVLSGFQVGDSAPISLKQLTLSQKIDYTLDGKEKPLPILRESLIPGTKICFDVTVDTSVCPYTPKEITEALNYFQGICYKYFYSRFRRGTKAQNIVWLGGGCGFLSKTIVYPLFGEDAVKVVDGIYKNTLGKNYGGHKHTKDLSLKISPHVCKCTRYRGELYDMGMGRIEFQG